MTLRLLPLLLLLHGGAAFAAAADEPGVVEVPEAAPAWSEAWQKVLALKGQAGYPAALEAWLKEHPHGPQAAPALVEQALMEDDLVKASATLRLARGEGSGSEGGAVAAYELARLDYARERAESALSVLEEADAWPRPDSLEADWLFWKAQCRFVLKGFRRSRDEFQHVAAAWPKHPRAKEALLGQAECDVALKDFERAEPVLQDLARPGEPFAAQALWDLAGMKVRAGDSVAARGYYERLKRDYPASFEASAVDEKLAALPKAPAPTATPARSKAPAFYVQVGAYSRRATADKEVLRLRKLRYAAKVQPRRLDGRTLYLVKVGPYRSRGLADARKKKLEAKLKERLYVVEE